ncbi:hypothetical protein HDU67_009132 [Dinochytrium kinnereticum]|nr:hypothetical protein HDU67_009132 [Dinochytrium kinnereticum]
MFQMNTGEQAHSNLNHYSLPGVLHFLQLEWRRFERERNEWEIERADLKAKLSFLEGERRGMENLKTDLLRRVKMLEFALRQERGKLLSSQAAAASTEQAKPEGSANSLSSDGIQPTVPGSVQQKVASSNNLVDNGVTSSVSDPSKVAKSVPTTSAPIAGGTLLGFSKGVGNLRSREILKNYLREANYLLAHSGLPVPVTSVHPANTRMLSPSPDENVAEVSPEPDPERAKGFAKEKESNSISASDSGPTYLEDLENPPFLSDDSRQASQVTVSSTNNKNSTDDKAIPKNFGNPVNSTKWIDEPDSSAKRKSSTTPLASDIASWKPKVSLASHLDSIRAVSFLPKDLALITGSEDGTAKLWNLKSPQSRKVPNDLEPVFTFRGHKGPITSITISPDSQYLFTGSLDATVLCWKIPPIGTELYGEYTPLKEQTLVAHTDAVWDVKLYPYPDQSSLLATASADSTVKIWDINGHNHNLKLTLHANHNTPEKLRPTSVDWLRHQNQRLAVAYRNSHIKVYDVETGSVVVELKAEDQASPQNQVNKIMCHPTLPLLITGGEDRHLRFYDLNSGRCLHSMIGHLDSVASLDISPSGLTFVSSGHDCSVRWWDMGSRACIQEYSTHRKKLDEGIWSVAYHPSRSEYVGTGGADGVCKLFVYEES